MLRPIRYFRVFGWLFLTEQEEMRRIIQDFSGVERTTVEYQTWAAYAAAAAGESGAILVSSDKGVCSDNGTTVTVTFDGVSLEVRGPTTLHFCRLLLNFWGCQLSWLGLTAN